MKKQNRSHLKTTAGNGQLKAFTLIELLIVVAIIGILSSIVFVSLTLAREKAQVAKYVSYADTLSTLAEGAVAVGAFDNLSSTSNWVCLGDYSEDGTCWGSSYTNNATMDSALEMVGSLPKGQFSPLWDDHGTVIRYYDASSAPRRIVIIASVISSDATKLSDVCGKLGSDWTVNVNNCRKIVYF